MLKNPFPLVMVLLFLSKQNSFSLPPINTLQMEAFLDGCEKFVHTLDKLNNLAQSPAPSIPDISSLMKLAGPMLSALSEMEDSRDS